jgi:hypothetical protein
MRQCCWQYCVLYFHCHRLGHATDAYRPSQHNYLQSVHEFVASNERNILMLFSSRQIACTLLRCHCESYRQKHELSCRSICCFAQARQFEHFVLFLEGRKLSFTPMFIQPNICLLSRCTFIHADLVTSFSFIVCTDNSNNRQSIIFHFKRKKSYITYICLSIDNCIRIFFTNQILL